AAALVAARAGPAPTTGRRRRPPNAWALLVQVAPELADWATYFSAGAAKRAAAEAGSTRAVTEHDAEALVRDADRFLAVVEQTLGLAPHAALAPDAGEEPWVAAS
ncbi:SAV_6107 family HEPN domain-containing protein, partial [Nocardioides sp.]|uniref:SAV_6107 family HEPN domain-containing protein n=1 Tax=Nocardioides sp. TaxID=35761 RepID=UPI0039E29165